MTVWKEGRHIGAMTVTPMMSQWQTCKDQSKNALLLFRLGDFYEAFYEDAQIISIDPSKIW